MQALIRRYAFAAAVAAVLAVMALIVVVKSLWPAGDEAAAAAKAAATAPVQVAAQPVARREFSDAIQALGTAQAKESIVISAKVTDTIRAIRFDSGDRVRRGQVLVELTNVEQAADFAEARAADVAAQEELRRFEALAERGFAPASRLDAVRATASATRARVEAGRSRVDDRIIRAPFSGVMGLRTASPGQLVTPGVQIGTLDDISQIKLDFDVPETQIAMLRRGVPIVARTAAFPDQEFSGVIDDIDSRVSPDTRTLRVRALLPNPNERLRPGMLMTVEVRSNAREALAVPEPAVVDQGDTPFVYVAAVGERGMKAERRPIRAGLRAGGFVEVLEGLNEGDQVIVEGVTRVRPDQAVTLTGGEEAGEADLRGRAPQQRPQGGAQPG